jgi:hypothetical protein
MQRRHFLKATLGTSAAMLEDKAIAGSAPQQHQRNYKFERTISREVLGNYLSRSICEQGLLNGMGSQR